MALGSAATWQTLETLLRSQDPKLVEFARDLWEKYESQLTVDWLPAKDHGFVSLFLCVGISNPARLIFADNSGNLNVWITVRRVNRKIKKRTFHHDKTIRPDRIKEPFDRLTDVHDDIQDGQIKGGLLTLVQYFLLRKSIWWEGVNEYSRKRVHPGPALDSNMLIKLLTEYAQMALVRPRLQRAILGDGNIHAPVAQERYAAPGHSIAVGGNVALEVQAAVSNTRASSVNDSLIHRFSNGDGDNVTIVSHAAATNNGVDGEFELDDQSAQGDEVMTTTTPSSPPDVAVVGDRKTSNVEEVDKGDRTGNEDISRNEDDDRNEERAATGVGPDNEAGAENKKSSEHENDPGNQNDPDNENVPKNGNDPESDDDPNDDDDSPQAWAQDLVTHNFRTCLAKLRSSVGQQELDKLVSLGSIHACHSPTGKYLEIGIKVGTFKSNAAEGLRGVIIYAILVSQNNERRAPPMKVRLYCRKRVRWLGEFEPLEHFKIMTCLGREEKDIEFEAAFARVPNKRTPGNDRDFKSLVKYYCLLAAQDAYWQARGFANARVPYKKTFAKSLKRICRKIDDHPVTLEPSSQGFEWEQLPIADDDEVDQAGTDEAIPMTLEQIHDRLQQLDRQFDHFTREVQETKKRLKLNREHIIRLQSNLKLSPGDVEVQREIHQAGIVDGFHREDYEGYGTNLHATLQEIKRLLAMETTLIQEETPNLLMSDANMRTVGAGPATVNESGRRAPDARSDSSSSRRGNSPGADPSLIPMNLLSPATLYSAPSSSPPSSPTPAAPPV